ncbi:MAG TPA: hypothetical protein VHM66_01415 [Solirubrobacterales bacterium]|nr:hypothetical protein [Solirubrobacterales bacterium]
MIPVPVTLRFYVHLMNKGIGNADFLDEAVKVGNKWATEDPVTAANGDLAVVALRPYCREDTEQPQRAANTGGN